MIYCYVLAPVRSAVLASRFPGVFLPEREPSCDINDPIEVLNLSPDADFDIQCTFLGLNDAEEYTFHWRSVKDSNPIHAILAFKSDGSLVLGLSLNCPDESEPESVVAPWLERLQKFARNPPRVFGTNFPIPPTTWGHELSPPKRSDFAA